MIKPKEEDTDGTVQAWHKRDLETQVFIGLNSSAIATKISNCETACQILEKLETLYGRNSQVTVEGLQRQFF